MADTAPNSPAEASPTPQQAAMKAELERLSGEVEAQLSQGDRAAARAACDAMLNLNGAYNPAHMLMARVMMPGENYAAILTRLHRERRPRGYAEIGVATGASMALAGAETHCVGIDPNPRVTASIAGRARLYPVTSDDFFARYDLSEELDRAPLDLAFIDGLHLFEQALRDFINLEKYAHQGTVVMIHDCFPPTELSAARDRVMAYWAGDVWRMIPLLIKYRPDLDVNVIPAMPSGLGLVTGLDPDSRVLEDRFDELVAEYMAMPYSVLEQRREELLSPIANSWDAIAERLPVAA
ncbi:MAG: class I SAM-dependent methyltransferase [Halieaceae bacterium]|nr:class I SAM-dependent methyltransferase [Halieaceae bacterium]